MERGYFCLVDLKFLRFICDGLISLIFHTCPSSSIQFSPILCCFLLRSFILLHLPLSLLLSPSPFPLLRPLFSSILLFSHFFFLFLFYCHFLFLFPILISFPYFFPSSLSFLSYPLSSLLSLTLSPPFSLLPSLLSLLSSLSLPLSGPGSLAAFIQRREEHAEKVSDLQYT
jgi:hypothetical protein